MTVQDAAIQILLSVGKPFHAKEIAKRAIKAGFWQSEGKPPVRTVSARLYSDIKKNGDKSAFVKVEPQIFALRDFAEIPSGAGPVSVAVEEALKSTPADAGFSFTDCAQKVLEESGDKKPMHDKENTGKALDSSWLVTDGKTPEATMNAQVYNEIKRQQIRCERSRLVQYDRGYVGFSQFMNIAVKILGTDLVKRTFVRLFQH